MSGHKKGKGQFKKTEAQRQGYKYFIANSLDSPDGTVPSQNAMLVGSDEINSNGRSEELYGKETVKKTPFKYRFLDWIKANLFAAIITAVVIGIGTTVISHRVQIAVLSNQIEYIETEIENLKDDNVDKDSLSTQLELIKSDLNGNISLSFNDIKWQLKELEEKINNLENDK